ncbi:hypothetical protein [Streptomyces sp. Ac-502]|uniref:hypothetical protein n=1 Tax=Streptomyces sp. Ac-502 TaxID=3342801 RepID=UPI0038622016
MASGLVSLHLWQSFGLAGAFDDALDTAKGVGRQPAQTESHGPDVFVFQDIGQLVAGVRALRFFSDVPDTRVHGCRGLVVQEVASTDAEEVPQGPEESTPGLVTLPMAMLWIVPWETVGSPSPARCRISSAISW